jgi:hypothetical protein
MKLIIALLTLFLPLLWEIYSDRKGETSEEKMRDVLWRLLLTAVAALTNFFLIGKPILDTIFLTLAIHWMFFDYIITWWLIKKGVIETHKTWFEYLGKFSVMDNLRAWVTIGAKGRFWVKVGVLVVAILIYII